MKTENIIAITENPFWISEILPYFFEGYEKDKIDLNVLYLILPFLLTKSIRNEILLTATTKSSFDSLFYNPNRKASNKILNGFNDSLMNKTSLLMIEDKYHRYHEITNNVLILAAKKGYLKIKDGYVIPLKKFDYSKMKKLEDFLYDYFKCGRNLGVVFNKESTSSLYRKCQIKRV